MRRMLAAAGLTAAAVALARRRRPRSLRDEVAIVTGGSRGLGLAIATELIAAGARVAICARDGDELDRAAGFLRAAGGDVLPVVCDVADERQAASLVERTVEHFGRLDLVVNNAGVIQVGPLDALTAENFRDAMDPMFWGTVHVTLAALPYLRSRRSGHICNITSIGGKVSVPHLLPYSCAKFAAVGFSEGLRAEVAAHGIGVTTVVPGLMRTGSDVQARMAGEPGREYAWFALGAAVPGLSMDGRRAARRIVRAIATRRTEIVLTLPARTAVLGHGIAPGAVQRTLAGAGRLLRGSATYEPGRVVSGLDAAREAPRAVVAATVLNRRAGRALNQPQPRT